MAKRAASVLANTNWVELGSRAVDEGNVETAREHFEQAVKLEKNVASHRFHLALVCDTLGDYGPPPRNLTIAVRLKPDLSDAARRLGMLLARRSLPGNVVLDPICLKAAYSTTSSTVNRLPRRRFIFWHAGNSLELKRTEGWLEMLLLQFLEFKIGRRPSQQA
jgi:hypothetical protein